MGPTSVAQAGHLHGPTWVAHIGPR